MVRVVKVFGDFEFDDRREGYAGGLMGSGNYGWYGKPARELDSDDKGVDGMSQGFAYGTGPKSRPFSGGADGGAKRRGRRKKK